MIRTQELGYSIGRFTLQVTVSVNAAEYFVLLGMTGSGKTLLLETLCGLRRAASGQIWLGQRDVTDAEPRDRHVGYVPQDSALFDHLTVAGNIGFALRVRRVPVREREADVERLAALLGIGHLLRRRIEGLSGGERQRVALARALAAHSPVLLLDEPVCALDEYTREVVCRELKTIQMKLGLSVIHVCHSFEEARLVADRIGILRDGRMEQTGTPAELMDRPASTHVARILRLENVFKGRGLQEGGRSQIRLENGFTIQADAPTGDVEFLVRSWDIRIVEAGAGRAANVIEGSVTDIEACGALVRLKIEGTMPLVAHIARREADRLSLRKGSVARLTFPETAVHAFGATA
ncbi:MAG: ABC transporter ATP-binding protein [Lentisphaerota bacterium]|jgi:ABC-type Fe3+/spermidine/putrescine transport system ATPase subunit